MNEDDVREEIGKNLAEQWAKCLRLGSEMDRISLEYIISMRKLLGKERFKFYLRDFTNIESVNRLLRHYQI
jgi:hypothetical protein